TDTEGKWWGFDTPEKWWYEDRAAILRHGRVPGCNHDSSMKFDYRKALIRLVSDTIETDARDLATRVAENWADEGWEISSLSASWIRADREDGAIMTIEAWNSESRGQYLTLD